MGNWFIDWNTSGCMDSSGAATLSCLKVVFANGVNALLAFIGLVTLIIFVLGGYKFINAAGDQKKFQSAKHNITYGILGLTVVVFAYFIIYLISAITGVSYECIRTFGFSCG